MEKVTIGLVEKVKINGHEVLARIDTGAKRNSVDIKKAKELELNEIIKTVKIKTSTGNERRVVVEGELEIAGKIIKTRFNLANRGHMEHTVLIGREVLNHGFLIDPEK